MDRAELASLLGAPGGLAGRTDAPAVVDERDPARFMASFAVAAAEGNAVFLADPAWGAAERRALAELKAFRTPVRLDGWLMIPSGGSGGGLKFARHDAATLAAAVRGFCAHFKTQRVDCVNILPLHHVSGFMAWMRCALTGGACIYWDWKRIESGSFPAQSLLDRRWFLSLVPTQLQRLLASAAAVEWLRGFEAVFVGGGPMWPELADRAVRLRVPVSPTYGLTETAAMVAALPPNEFAGGARSCGKAMPHAKVEIDREGAIRISGDSVFRGYYPDWSDARKFTTDDLGRIDERGHLHILGRRDDLIITGGKKVDPLEVEAALRGSGEFEDVVVVGLSDLEWGSAVVACYPEADKRPNLSRVATHLVSLASFKHPRKYVPVAAWPRNAQGKINRTELAKVALRVPGGGG